MTEPNNQPTSQNEDPNTHKIIKIPEKRNHQKLLRCFSFATRSKCKATQYNQKKHPPSTTDVPTSTKGAIARWEKWETNTQVSSTPTQGCRECRQHETVQLRNVAFIANWYCSITRHMSFTFTAPRNTFDRKTSPEETRLHEMMQTHTHTHISFSPINIQCVQVNITKAYIPNS